MRTLINVTGSKDTFVELPIDVTYSKFPAGEPYIKFPKPIHMYRSINVKAHIANADGMMTLMALKDAIDHTHFKGEVYLYLSYMPGGRQDRVVNEGESLTVKLYAAMINNAFFDKVSILDPHSDVTSALLERVDVRDNSFLAMHAALDIEAERPFYLVSPDAGADKKVKHAAKELMNTINLPNFKGVVKADKTRDLKTNALSGFEVRADDLEGADCIILDDICDGGGTFVGLAEELKKKNCGKIILAVSHGLFTKGLEPLKQHIDSVMTYPHFNNFEDPFIKYIFHPEFSVSNLKNSILIDAV